MTPIWHVDAKRLEVGPATWLMAVINLTPDSFYAGSRFPEMAPALHAADEALAAGAAILDLGAESTRPGSAPLTPQDEQARLLPVLRELRQRFPRVLLSVDTRHAATARAALAAGADILNDVTGLEDPALADAAAASGCGVVAMHRRGDFASMQRLPPLADPVAAVSEGFATILARAAAAGIAPERIVLDPGFGFGKNLDENYPLFRGLESWRSLGRPLLAGVSRKSFLGHTLGGVPPADRLYASLAAATAAVLAGAAIIRTHDVAATRDAVVTADRIRAAS